MANPAKGSHGHSFFLNWDTSVVTKKFEAIADKIPVALAMAVREEAEAVKDDAVNNLVPRDTSDLAKSGYAVGPEKVGTALVARVGFGGSAAPYAFVTHENPRAGKTGGMSPSGRKYKHWAKVGGWKYLEKALAKSPRRLNARVARIVRAVWGGVA